MCFIGKVCDNSDIFGIVVGMIFGWKEACLKFPLQRFIMNSRSSCWSTIILSMRRCLANMELLNPLHIDRLVCTETKKTRFSNRWLVPATLWNLDLAHVLEIVDISIVHTYLNICFSEVSGWLRFFLSICDGVCYVLGGEGWLRKFVVPLLAKVSAIS